MSLVTSPIDPLAGLGWPVSRETSTPDVSRETDPPALTGLGWPREDDRMPSAEGSR
jgi:hypothetical protein